MKTVPRQPIKRITALALLPLLLSGCGMVVMSPSGDIAAQQRDLLLIATWLMLLIIVPVMALTVWFAWRYRDTNKDAEYDPEWSHSTKLELVIWSAPLLIIICLGAVTWVGTHLLDPYRPLDRIAEDKDIHPDVKPLEVNVVALDWKWLFIYPEQNIATVNEMAAPTDRPINFRITSSSVMNAFYVPAMSGMIYAMPGMESKLHAVMNHDGVYEGFSANYSGAGFSGMRFAFHSLSEADFNAWVQKARTEGGDLTRATYLELERPSERVPVQRYRNVEPGLYQAALNLCVEPGKMCMGEMMAIDAKGGLGKAGIYNVMPLAYDKFARRGTTALGTDKPYIGSICTADGIFTPSSPAERIAARVNPAPLRGHGLQRPYAVPATAAVTSPFTVSFME